MSIAGEARAKLEGITPGPWSFISGYNGPFEAADFPDVTIGGRDIGDGIGEADAEFIAAAPDLVRGLLAELDQTKAEVVMTNVELGAALATIQQVRELHHITCEHDGDNCVYGINCPLAFCIECDTGTVCDTARILGGES